VGLQRNRGCEVSPRGEEYPPFVFFLCVLPGCPPLFPWTHSVFFSLNSLKLLLFWNSSKNPFRLLLLLYRLQTPTSPSLETARFPPPAVLVWIFSPFSSVITVFHTPSSFFFFSFPPRKTPKLKGYHFFLLPKTNLPPLVPSPGVSACFP